MNALLIAVVSCLAVAYAAPSGHGVLVDGPSGIVTDHGPIGPAGHGIVGGWGGHGLGWGHGAVVAAPAAVGAVLTAPTAHAVISGPAHVGAAVVGAGWGHGGWAGGWGGHGGWGAGALAHGVHGVVVQGPHTVPATIAGPSGKVHADGLWGPTLAHGHGHGHW